ncbi:poly(U)-specific endoribonuclease isoform X2, partial [Cricetulus griseus]|uniref:poly(U)-specific endoribonuclease isoform X2 n=1 Tax=Cricetulus griseus TaxID=10029 RepID=UPI0004548496
MRNLTVVQSASVIVSVPSMTTAVMTMDICALLKKGPQSQRHSSVQRKRFQSTGRCREAYDKHHPCHCNERCRKFGDCCEDFDSLCGDH